MSATYLWQPLFANLALIMLALAAWDGISEKLQRLNEVKRNFVFGIAMACACLGSMSMAHLAANGVHMDFRGPLIGIAALFGGLPAAMVTAITALLYRIYLGGAVLTGVVDIVLATLIGVAFHWVYKGQRFGMLAVTALSVALAGRAPLALMTLPTPARTALWTILPTAALLTFAATLFLGFTLIQSAKRRRLTETNAMYRAMVEVLPDCLNIKDAEGRFLAANAATARLMGAATPDELIGRTDFDFFPADQALKFRQDEDRVLASRTHATLDQRKILTEGEPPTWLSTLKVPLVLGQGLTGLVTHNRDVTVAKELQQQLEKTQHHLDQALEHMSDGLAMYSPEGRLLFCNGRYSGLFPLTAHLRVPGADFASLIRASVLLGEEPLSPGVALDQHVAAKVAGLRLPGETIIELGGGRVYASQTSVLPDGATLRIMSDVTERRAFERSLEHQALHDPLTGLPNRTLFNREIVRMRNLALQTETELLVALVDLDHFKRINDTMGHAAGDALLVEIAKRLASAIRSGDLAARLGGDEFAILMQCRGANYAALANRLSKSITKPLAFGSTTLIPSGTIGYTVYPEDASGTEDLLKNADRALYQAKEQRRGSWKQWKPESSDTERRRLADRK